MTDKTLRIRDGIVGAAIMLTVALGLKVHSGWFWVTGGIGFLLIASAFSGICFLYSFLGKCNLKS